MIPFFSAEITSKYIESWIRIDPKKLNFLRLYENLDRKASIAKKRYSVFQLTLAKYHFPLVKTSKTFLNGDQRCWQKIFVLKRDSCPIYSNSLIYDLSHCSLLLYLFSIGLAAQVSHICCTLCDYLMRRAVKISMVTKTDSLRLYVLNS